MQIKSPMRLHFIPTGLAKAKKKKEIAGSMISKDVELLQHQQISGDSVNW